MVEVMVSMSVLLLGMLALSMTTAASFSLHRSEQELSRARESMRSAVEGVTAIADSLRGDPAGWSTAVTQAFAPGGNPGSNLPVFGLDAIGGGMADATIEILTDETLTDFEIGRAIGMPRDLTGDGFATSSDVSSNATLLPVTIRIRWVGVNGERELFHAFYILGF